MPPETHCLARAERSGPTVAPCQTFPTPARGVHRLPSSQQGGILSPLATCNAARSSTGTGFAGIASLPASSTWAYFRATPFYGVQKLRRRKPAHFAQRQRASPQASLFLGSQNPQRHDAPFASHRCRVIGERMGRPVDFTSLVRLPHQPRPVMLAAASPAIAPLRCSLVES